MRVDKWLWAARFFKTRSIAAQACELGRVQLRGQPVKPARELRVGDVLEVKTPGGMFQVAVLGFSEMRGPATAAQALYRESEESKEARRQWAEARRAEPHFETTREGKPSKRDRRQLGRLRGR